MIALYEPPLPPPMLAAPGIEVVLERTSTGIVAVVHGGPLDGDRFRAEHPTDPEEFQRRICVMCRMRTWPRFKVRVRR